MNKNVIYQVILFFFIVFNSFFAIANEKSPENNAWIQWKKQDDISLFYHLPTSTSERSINIKAQFTVKTSLSGFLLFIQDTDNIPTWLETAYESKIIKQINQNENIFVTYFSSIWPVEPRHMVLQTKTIQHDDYSLEISSKDAGTRQTQKNGSIQIDVLEAHWLITPRQNDGLKRISYTLRINPKGHVPLKILNELALSSMFSTIINIKALLPKSVWQTFSIQNIKELPTSL